MLLLMFNKCRHNYLHISNVVYPLRSCIYKFQIHQDIPMIATTYICIKKMLCSSMLSLNYKYYHPLSFQQQIAK